MTLPRLQLTDLGSKEMAKPGDLVITRVAFGSRFSGYATIKTTTAMGSELSSVSPTVREEQGFRVIDIVYDNSQLTSTDSIREIGVFAKVGNGTEFLAYYGADNIGVQIPAKNNQSYTMRLKFKIKLTGRDNITVEVNPNISGLATSDSVNQIAGKVDKLKNGASIEETLDLAGLKTLLGSTNKQRAPQDLDTLGTPGIYWYEQSHNASSKGIASGYGFVIVYSNMVGSLGQAGNWTWQIYTATNGRMWVRYKINQDPWKVQGVASGEYLTSLLKRLGLDEWGAGFNIATCSSGTNFGTFLGSSAVPIGFNIVKDNNPPMKEVFVWKSSNTYAYCFAPRHNGGFLVNSLQNGRFGEWRDLGQGLTVQVSPNQDFGDYLQSSAVPIGLSAQKDSRTGAFGQVTKVDNNNVFFSGALREQGKTYQVAYAVVYGVKPSAFTKWPLT
ncbi:pyocin knob domain-containing protein [Abiotrophia defectiva]|uniref:pyocin knob domain-containing protein n=1 Tax=Abiotrophia defectiva TaxID=46125 RepID=UPI0026EBBBE6|nr:pyocin knob domain-containing protein [Abiotrophia defectiva]